MEQEEKLQKFLSSGQAAVKLQIALEEAFRPELPDRARQTYREYLRRRIRPAAEQCILRQDTDLLDALADAGWLDGLSLDDFLRMAGQQGKNESFVWLLRRKQNTSGFHRPEYPL